MNVLTDRLPETLMVDGVEYPIDTDHRTAIKCILAFEDNDLTQAEKIIVLLGNIYETIPENTQAAIEAASKFLDGTLTQDRDGDGPSPVRVFSLSKDASFIYAAFHQTHHIDLNQESMHWWKFLALFSDLGSDTTFVQLMGLRKRVKTGKATKEERQVASEMGDMFRLPELDHRTIGQKMVARDFEEKVRMAKEKRGK